MSSEKEKKKTNIIGVYTIFITHTALKSAPSSSNKNK